MKPSITYKDAGVDIQAGNQLIDKISPFAKKTARPEMLGGLGGFGALFELPPGKYHHPVLVSGTDGVGTKLKLAFNTGKHDRIGIDLVAMCVNDLIVQGAEPLFFLDYFATGKLDLNTTTTVIKGIAKGCEIAGASLAGGETAEMPGMYQAEEYDLAGFCVGVVEKEKIIDGSLVSNGDVLIGLSSSGPHSNGYSLIRKILEVTCTPLDFELEGRSMSDILLEPTRIYVKSVLTLLKSIPLHALSHITGGGLLENIPRVLPADKKAIINTDSWEMPAIFDWLRDQGNLSPLELFRTFNCGIGMVLCLPKNKAEEAMKILQSCNEPAQIIGHIRERAEDEEQVLLEQ